MKIPGWMSTIVAIFVVVANYYKKLNYYNSYEDIAGVEDRLKYLLNMLSFLGVEI